MSTAVIANPGDLRSCRSTNLRSKRSFRMGQFLSLVESQETTKTMLAPNLVAR